MMKLRPASRALRVAAIVATGAFFLAANAAATVPETDPRWLPWLGCWSPSGATEDAASAVSGVQRVCVRPVEGAAGVELLSVMNGEIASRLRIDASDARQPVHREGCTGWESARWSEDAERLYLRSELTCAGNIVRRSSGIIAVVSPSDWVDVQVVSVGDQRSTRILRYRSAPDSSALSREIATAVRDRELSRQTARLAAASTPTIGDVVEASREVEPAVVEAWLLQRMPRLAVDASALRHLADARVPTPVIDLIVALGAPERYGDRLVARGYTFMRIDAPRITTVAVAPPQPAVQEVESRTGSSAVIVEGREFYGHLHRHYEGCGHYDVVSIGGIPVAPYGFYPYWLRGYGYGAYGGHGGYGYYPYDIPDPYRPAPSKPASRGTSRVIDLPDRRPTAQPDVDPGPQPAGGRVIKGSGYTRPTAPAEPTTSRGSSPAALPPRSGQAKPAQEAKPETKPEPKPEAKPAPASEPRSAKRRPPSGD